jgi:hypothetical protein
MNSINKFSTKRESATEKMVAIKAASGGLLSFSEYRYVLVYRRKQPMIKKRNKAVRKISAGDCVKLPMERKLDAEGENIGRF